ncbi:MAG: phospho-N-acetylmuramoyl-pentapeptide-transferase [Chloroflexi bacterium RBG_16_68_14]|nr:MAG: phospho-N-acetylmuramoyl-pentapeptide-transferase [Chloroflexi bacterium RBG_16_68_14]
MVRALVIGSAASLVSLLAGGPLVALLGRLGVGKAISDEGPESHHVKAGTPTMGGLLILGTILAFTLPTNLVGHPSILLPLGVMGAVGLIGFADDLLTLQGRARVGGHERLGLIVKTGALLGVGLGAGLILFYSLDAESLNVPHFGKYELGAGYIPIAVLVIATTTSAAAVTDGLDGLLGGVMALAFAAYGVIAFLQGQSFLATFSFTVVGAIVGFLWYNAHPARVFMGETGAMPLGAGLATVALMTGWWLLLPVVGVVLVAEALSDVVQIGSFQLTGRRVLKMAPLHHHCELLGWSEPQVVLRFWLVGAVGALLGIALALTD